MILLSKNPVESVIIDHEHGNGENTTHLKRLQSGTMSE
jgi:hypothetical protein